MKKGNNANGNNRPDVVNHLANAHGEHHVSRSSQQVLKEQLLDALLTDNPAKEHVPELLKPSPTNPTTTGEVVHNQLFPILDALAGETVPATPENHTLDNTINTAPIASDIDSGLFFNDELSVLLSNPVAQNKQHAQQEKIQNQSGLNESLSMSKTMPSSTKSAEITSTPATISTDQVINAINSDLFANPIFDNNPSISKKQPPATSQHPQSKADKHIEESQIGTFTSGFFNLELNTFNIDSLSNLSTKDNHPTLTSTSTEKVTELDPFDLTINQSPPSLETFPNQLTAEYGILDKRIDDQQLLPPLLSSDLITESLNSHYLSSNALYHIFSRSEIKPLNIDRDFTLAPEITIVQSLLSSSLPNNDFIDFSQLSFTPFISFNEEQHSSLLEIKFSEKANNHLPETPELMNFISLSINNSAITSLFDTKFTNTKPFAFDNSVLNQTDFLPPATTSDFSSALSLQQVDNQTPSPPVDINLLPLSFDAFALTQVTDTETASTEPSAPDHAVLYLSEQLPIPATTEDFLSIASLDLIIHDIPASLLAPSKLNHLHFVKFNQAFNQLDNQPFDQHLVLEPISLSSTSLLPIFIHDDFAENNFNLSIKANITELNTNHTTENNSKFFSEVLFKDPFDFFPEELFSTTSSVFNTDKPGHEITSPPLLGKDFFDKHLYTDPLMLNAEDLAHFPQTPFISPVITSHQIQQPNSQAMVHQIISALTQENGHSLPTDNQNHESTTIEKLLNIKPEIIYTLLKGEITLTGIHIPSNTDHQLLSKIINNQESLIIFHDFNAINYYTSEHHYLLDYTSPYDQECIQHDIY